MAKVVPNKKEELSVKITVDTTELDSTVEKVERLRNALEEINGLMSDIFTLKSAPAESEQDFKSLKKALFFNALACEKLEDRTFHDYIGSFDAEGNPLVSSGLIEKREKRSIRAEAKAEVLRDFFKSNGLLEEYQVFIKRQDGW